MNTFVKQMSRLARLSLTALIIGAVITATASAAAVNWTGASGADLFWANPGNWAGGPPLPPDATSDVTFNNTGAVPLTNPPTVTNEVTASTEIKTVWFQQQDPALAVHTTVIDPGQTLKISGNAAAAAEWGVQGNNYSLFAGYVHTDPTLISQTVIKGDGTLDISSATGESTGGDIVVRETNGASPNANGPHTAILDLQGLETFTANADQFHIGYSTASNSTYPGNQRPSGTVYLARNNTIKLNSSTISSTQANLIVAYANGNSNTGSTGAASYLYLGESNLLYLNSMYIGDRKSTGNMLFNTAFSNPTLFMRGQDESSPVSIIAIGDSLGANTSTAATGTVDLRGGDVDILADYIILGRTYSGGTGGTAVSTGKLYFDTGSVSVNNLIVGDHIINNSTQTGTGIVNVSGTASLAVSNSLVLASWAGGAGASNGTLNISGGTVTLGADITDGGGASAINMTGGLLDLAGKKIGSAGTPINTISLENGTLDNVLQINADMLTILNGVTLNVSLGVPLNLGDTFDILNWNSLSGTFSTVNLPALSGGLSWDSSNLYVDGTVQVIPEPETIGLLFMGAAMFYLRRRR